LILTVHREVHARSKSKILVSLENVADQIYNNEKYLIWYTLEIEMCAEIL